jgi:hypothetical protein
MRRNAPRTKINRNIEIGQDHNLLGKKGFVYVIDNNQEDGIIKIGYTKDLARRLKTFQTAMPNDIRLLTYWPCAQPQKNESALHAIFKSDRVLGEWFKIGSIEYNLWHYGLIIEIGIKTSLCTPIAVNEDIYYWLQRGHIGYDEKQWESSTGIEDFYPEKLLVDFKYSGFRLDEVR